MHTGFTEALQSLGMLKEDVFLGMQALNLGLVNELIVDIEDQMVREYLASDSTPMPTAMMASALSQLWIFGLYELLRTWRQRVRQVIRFTCELDLLNKNDREERISAEVARLWTASMEIEGAVAPIPVQVFERAVRREGFAKQLKLDLVRFERAFRKIEVLRISLAKHELPRVTGSYADMSGYARIDVSNRSLCWQISLRNDEVLIISRREIVEECLNIKREIAVLPKPVVEKVKQFVQHGYGIKRVILVLKDGREFESIISWNKEIWFAREFEKLPFDPEEVVDARNVERN